MAVNSVTEPHSLEEDAAAMSASAHESVVTSVPGPEEAPSEEDRQRAYSEVGTAQKEHSVRLKHPSATAPSSPVHRRVRVRSLADATVSKGLTRLTFLLGDGIGLLLVLTGAFLVMETAMPQGLATMGPSLFVAVPVALSSFALAGLYRLTFAHPAHEMRKVALVTAVLGTTAAVTALLSMQSHQPAMVVGALGLASVIVLPLCRVGTRVLFSRWSWWGVPTVVVHEGDGDPPILDTMDTWPEIGLRPVAVLNEPKQDNDEGGHVADPPEWASYLADRFGDAYAILSLPTASNENRAQRVMEYAKVFDHVFVPSGNPGAPALWTSGCGGDGLDGYVVQNAASVPGLKLIKRAIDIVGASLTLAVTFPLFAIISLLIRNGSSGPIFFRQRRMGPDGQDFEVLKFRSMYEDADERLDEVLDTDPERREEYERYHKLKDDPRVTPTGTFLRRTSLDELPQLLNVLRGEMSLVGPRAYMPSERPKMKGMESVVLSARPGVTGLWQVSGRNKLSFTERVDLDVHYVQNWSLTLDLYLLVRTIPTVITGEGAS